jgi:hypothetical protein
MGMRLEHDRQGLLAVLGISAGVATGVAAGFWLWRRRVEETEGALARWSEPRGSAQDVAEAFREDGKLSRRRIDVDTIAEGVVELSGSVRDRAEADRAVGIAQRTTGVYTVVNRLRIEDEESQRETTRRRWTEGAPELRERKHYGMSVGMGPRRHAPETDPDRPSDKPKMLDRDLDVGNVADGTDGGPNPVSGVGGVEDPYMKPGDLDAIREAGLDPTPRPTSTPQESAGGDEAPDEAQDGSDDRG